jgi:hypothetical protein
MRIPVLILILVAISGCTAMLVSGGAESDKQQECTKSEKEAEKRGC